MAKLQRPKTPEECQRFDKHYGGKTLYLMCPGCKFKHIIVAGGEGSSPGAKWDWNGSMDNPTFHPSLKVYGYGEDNQKFTCHSYIRNGKIEFLGDSTHELAGQTIELPDLGVKSDTDSK